MRLTTPSLALGAMTALSLGLVLHPRVASAYPEFQKWAQKASGRTVSCGLCHAHPDGPEGVKHGQTGSLTQPEMEALGRARTAFEPGQKVHSPILNAFGNRIIEVVGKKTFLSLRDNPAALAPLLGKADLDDDGLPDAREYVDGTDPLNPHHGDPRALGLVNLRRYGVHLGLLVLATMCGLWRLGHMLRWFAQATEAALDEQPEQREDRHV